MAAYRFTKSAVATPVTNGWQGASLTWQLDYSCVSVTSDCTNTLITDTLPGGVAFSTATGGGLAAGNTVTWNLGTVPSGTTANVQVSGTVPCSLTDRTFNNTAGITGDGAGSTNKSATITVNGASTCTPPPPDPFSKSGPSVLNPGGRLHYSFNLPALANATVVEDTLPSIPTYLNSEIPAPVTATITCNGTTWVPTNGCATPQKIRFLIPAVTDPVWATSGASIPYQLKATVRMRVPVGTPVPSNITNNAAVYTATGTGTPGSSTGVTGTASGNVAAAAPMTAISKWAYKLPGQPDSGGRTPTGQSTSLNDDVGYEISFGNNGGGNAAGAPLLDPVITDLIDNDTDFIAGTNWWKIAWAPTGCTNPTFDTVPNFAPGRTLLRWRFAGCTLNFDQDYNDTIGINLTTRVKLGTAAGTLIANDATGQESAGITPQLCDQTLVADTTDVDGDSNTAEKLCRAAASFNMPKVANLESSKWVNGAADPVGSWSRYPNEGRTSVDSQGFAVFRAFVRPKGNVDTTKLELTDVLPAIGDTGVNGVSQTRLSEWGQILAGPVVVEYLPYESITAPVTDLNTLTGWTLLNEGTDYTSLYSHSTNPCRNDENEQTKFGTTNVGPTGCTNDWTANMVDAKAFALNITKTMRRWNATPQSGDVIRVTVRVKDVGNASDDVNKIAWNSFAMTPTDATGQEFLTAEPIKVGVRMTPLPQAAPSVGDYVWYDENNDGQQDSFEEGIDGVLVTLFDATGTAIRTATTGVDPNDANRHGFYRFDGLDQSATYTIKLNRTADGAPGGPLDGFVLSPSNVGDDTTDNDAVLVSTTPAITNATSGTGSSHTPTYDFGFWKRPNYSVGNRVWFDDDNSGDINGTEAGVDNVVVNLFKKNTDGSFTAAGTDTTQGGGFYRFDGLDPADYYVQIAPSNFNVGGPLEGRRSSTGAAQDSDPNTNIDSDDNGLTPTTLADYTATGVLKGVVSNVVTLGPGRSEPSGETNLSASGQGAEDRRANMTVDFGFYTPKFAVGNYVWEDINRDGMQGTNAPHTSDSDSNEPGINGLTVSLFKSNNTPVGTTTTADGPDGKPGFYLFDGLLSGDYHVVFDKPAGTEFTLQTAGSNAAIDSNANPANGASLGKTAVFTLDESLPTINSALDGPGLTASYVNRDIDAGISKRYSLGNLVWHDANGNGQLDKGEPGIDGVNVELYNTDASGLPVGTVLSAQMTSNGGYYLFTGLVGGDYVVVISRSQLQAGGALEGFYSSGTTMTGEAAAALANADIDSDDNGTRAASGDVLSSKVTLGDTTTEPTGEAATPGHADTTPDAQSNVTVDFGFLTMSLGNLVWEDTDNNGTRNGTEPAIANVPVFLYADANTDGQPDGNVVAATTTSATGQYLFTGLVPGGYVVEIESPAGMYSSSGTVGSYSGPFEPGKGDNTDLDTQDHGTTVGNRIRSATITLTPATEPTAAVETDGVSGLTNNAIDSNTDLTVDFGLVPGAAIGNYVWLDNNRDGLQNEPDDFGINGITVNLIDTKGNTVKTTVTSADTNGKPGYYRFDVIPGDFKVAFDLTTLPEGMVVSPKDRGTNDAKDSDADPVTGLTAFTTLDPREYDPNWDLGVYPTAVTVGNYVWFDENGDGIQNDGPNAGFKDVKATLLDMNDNPVTVDIQGNPIESTRLTDADGYYLFSNLKPGTYKVKFEAPADYEITRSKIGEPDKDSNGLIATSKALKGGQSDLTLDLGLVKIVAPIRLTPNTVPTTTVPGVPTTPGTPTTLPEIAPKDIVIPSTTVTPRSGYCGTIYVDVNRTSVRDASEQGRAGATVTFKDANGKVIAAAVTDANGDYCVKIPVGEYTVEVSVPGSNTKVRNKAKVLGIHEPEIAEDIPVTNVEAELALTGQSSIPMVASAIAAIMIGALIVLSARRRRLQPNNKHA